MGKMELITDRTKLMYLVPEQASRWKYAEYPFLFMVDGEVVIIGELAVKAPDMEVKWIESPDKLKGHARTFINYLKEKPEITCVWGESLPVAVPFWTKVGAKFEPSEYKRYIEAKEANEEWEEAFLIPFEIPC